MDLQVVPRFNSNERLLEISSARKPSSSTLKYMRAEIRLHSPKEAFLPGDTIEGDFVIFKTKENKVIKDVYFNDIEIKFENKFISALGSEATFFTMDDSPSIADLPRFATCPNKHPNFESCHFPFSFTVPEQHLEDTCVENHFLHRCIVPSYGCPQLCGQAFHSSEVAGLKPSQSVAMKKLKELAYGKFCNFYAITCHVKQNIKGIDKPYIIFTRSMEIKVRSDFNLTLPTNITQTTLDIGDYFNISDINPLDELHVSKSIGLKSPEERSSGSIAVSSLLPSPLSENSSTSFPLDLRFIPSSTSSPLPSVTALVELIQYTVQSSACIPPQTAYANLPTSTSGFSLFKVNGKQTLIQRIQTVTTETKHLDSMEWIPDYTNPDAYVKQAEITVPKVVKDDVLQSTFHSCHIQNIYALQVKLVFDQKDEEEEVVESRKSSLGSLFGKRAESGEKYVVEKNAVQFNIPITVI